MVNWFPAVCRWGLMHDILCLRHSGNYGFAVPYNSGPTCGDCPNDCDDKLCSKWPRQPPPHTHTHTNTLPLLSSIKPFPVYTSLWSCPQADWSQTFMWINHGPSLMFTMCMLSYLSDSPHVTIALSIPLSLCVSATANPCPHTDQYSNCAYLAQQWGCGHTQVASSCPATCKCANLIKWSWWRTTHKKSSSIPSYAVNHDEHGQWNLIHLDCDLATCSTF